MRDETTRVRELTHNPNTQLDRVNLDHTLIEPPAASDVVVRTKLRQTRPDDSADRRAWLWTGTPLQPP